MRHVRRGEESSCQQRSEGDRERSHAQARIHYIMATLVQELMNEELFMARLCEWRCMRAGESGWTDNGFLAVVLLGSLFRYSSILQYCNSARALIPLALPEFRTGRLPRSPCAQRGALSLVATALSNCKGPAGHVIAAAAGAFTPTQVTLTASHHSSPTLHSCTLRRPA